MKLIGKAVKWTILVLILAVIVVFVAIGERRFEVKEYTLKSDRLPAAFDGLRIAQLSDIHNTEKSGLLDAVENAKPELIFLTGDLVSRGDSEIPTHLVTELTRIAPVYYVSGNHEAENERYPDFIAALCALGVNVLENDTATISRGDDTIRIAGIADVLTVTEKKASDEQKRFAVDDQLVKTVDGEDSFTLLLAHRPEFYMLYEAHSVDVVFSGHAHGGAVRLPFIGALIAPGQGFFPQYTDGVYESEYSTLVVSTGLGKSSEPFRLNCPYELVIVTLKQG